MHRGTLSVGLQNVLESNLAFSRVPAERVDYLFGYHWLCTYKSRMLAWTASVMKARYLPRRLHERQSVAQILGSNDWRCSRQLYATNFMEGEGTSLLRHSEWPRALCHVHYAMAKYGIFVRRH